MSHELVKASPVIVPASVSSAALPVLVERAGGAARFAWDEFFYAEHHNPHTQKAYLRAVRRFLGWAEGQGVELPAITPGMVGQYLVGLGGSAAKRNQHLAALRGFFDRLVNRHVCILNPAASVKGVKEQVIEGKTPEISVEQARTLLASIDTGACRRPAGPGDPGDAGLYRLPGRGGRQAPAGRFSAATGRNTCCGSRKRAARAGKSRCGTTWRGLYWPMSRRRASPAMAKDSPLFRASNGRTRKLTGKAMSIEADLRAGQAAAERCRAAVAAVAAFVPGDGDHRSADARACRWRMCNTWPGTRSRERPGFTTGGRRR